jgi:hypothetical protein
MRFPSKRTLAAIFALTAWVNVQAMTCCGILSTGAPGQASHASHSSPTPVNVSTSGSAGAEEHACCPRAQEKPSSQSASNASQAKHAERTSHASHDGGCDMDHGATSAPGAAGHASPCCGSHEPALASASLDFVSFESRVPSASIDALLADLDVASQPTLSSFASSAGPPRAASSSRYLSLQRFLI